MNMVHKFQTFWIMHTCYAILPKFWISILKLKFGKTFILDYKSIKQISDALTETTQSYSHTALFTSQTDKSKVYNHREIMWKNAFGVKYIRLDDWCFNGVHAYSVFKQKVLQFSPLITQAEWDNLHTNHYFMVIQQESWGKD